MRTLAAIIAVAMCGCIYTAGSFGRRHAIVDDVTSDPPFVAGYCVIAVDGKPVKRCRDPFLTVIPLVDLEPGTHKLTLQLADEKGNQSTVSADFESGKRYRIKSEDGELSIVESEVDGRKSGEG